MRGGPPAIQTGADRAPGMGAAMRGMRLRPVLQGVAVAVGLAWTLAAGAGHAADGATAGDTASAPNATNTAVPIPTAATPATAPDAARRQSDCTVLRRQATQGTSSELVIELDPQTLWRPRGAEVRFTINGSGISVQNVQVCFAWSYAQGPNASRSDAFHAVRWSPLVRAIGNAEGKILYGAVVPVLPPVPAWWPTRILQRNAITQYTGLFIVPVAYMQVIAKVTTADGTTAPVSVVLPVGITSAAYALILVLVAVAATCLFLYWITRNADLPGRNPVLKLIATMEGYASLAQLQIMLWTLVVGAAAIYVMALSGNLIDVTSGMLVLLGISGATTALARVPGTGMAGPGSSPDAPSPDAPAADAPATDDAPPADAPMPADAAGVPAPIGTGARRQPRWSDLIVAEDSLPEVDVTRVQMLIFTVVSAVFVGLKAVTSYEFPDVPEGFLVLLGISNGLYITGRHLPRGKVRAAPNAE